MAKVVGIGVTGGIAAYKIPELVSLLKKNDLEVVVMMTSSAAKLIAPLTFRTMSGREVLTDLWHESKDYKVQHIGVAEELDLLVIAPATANFIGKMAHGIADDLLSTVVLANTAPVLVAPAMNTNMLHKPVVQANIKQLAEFGYRIMTPGSGLLACGISGDGRLPEIREIYDTINDMLYPVKDLCGKKIMVNAGTTCEDIDPVRFIANRGTGKMGYSIAEIAAERGAEVILVSGNSPLSPPPGVELIKVWGAQEMCEIMLKHQTTCDVIIGAAAVGDFTVKSVAKQKVKKSEDKSQNWVLELVGTPDILKELGRNKTAHQILVGFAAETEDLIANARHKLQKKNLDFIVANDVTQEGAGFAADTNIVTIIPREGDVVSLPKMSKREVAAVIIDRVKELLG